MRKTPKHYLPRSKQRALAAMDREFCKTVLSADRFSEAEQRLLHIAADLEAGRLPSADDAAAHATALWAIIDGADPKKALGLSGRQKQGRDPKSDEAVRRTEFEPVLRIRRLMKKSTTC